MTSCPDGCAEGWALRPLPVNEVNEMVEMINDFMDMLVHSTITGICLAFWIIALMGIWKWFLGMMKRALLYLFPGLKTWADKRRKKDNGNDNDSEPAGRPDHRD